MSLIKHLLGERKSETEGFRKIYETTFDQGFTAAVGSLVGDWSYQFHAAFFINPENDIVYMLGEVQNPSVGVPGQPDLEQEVQRQLSGMQRERIAAYSVCRDGTEIITGNLGLEELNRIFGGVTIQLPEEIFMDGWILRNIIHMWYWMRLSSCRITCME
ncbi:hypothetical protein HYS48_01245 [Candidatus Woesearchaeota archaeon]|nr:hypothetical protein [Candidatus Woesearchaeota archaeon]